MGAAFRGTFAIAWSDSEIDGLRSAPMEALIVGASWSWHGRAVRIDGPQDVLVLGSPDDHLRARVARSARRLAGAAAREGGDDGRLDPDGPLREGFSVTDGRRQYAVAILRDGARPLLAFPGDVPVAGVEHWVTHIAGNLRRPMVPDRPAEICFTRGTRLRTPEGDRAVEDLQPGDRVLTRDDGPQEVLWTGHSHVSGARLHVIPDLRPVRIRANALDTGLPDAELLVSPRHRVLLRGPAARVLFDTDEVLVAAGDLVNDRTITVARGLRGVTYVHLMLARHQVVWANGVPSETFHPAEAPLERLEASQRERLFRLFPDIARDPARYGAPARRLLTRAEAAIMMHGRRRP
jgi:hypothetical protein